MATIPWSDSTPNQALAMQASNSAMQNDLRYQCLTPGEQINGHPNVYGSHTQPTQQTNYQNVHYTSQSGQTANGNYLNDKAADLSSVRNRNSFAAHGSASGFSVPVPQLPLRNQTLMKGNGSYIAQSGSYVPHSHYATHQNPLKADVPRTMMVNRTQSLLAPSAMGGIPHAQVTSPFLRVYNGALPSGTQGNGDLMDIDHLNRITDFLKGASVSPYPVVPDVMNWGDGTVKKSDRNGSNNAVALPTGKITTTENVLVDRGKEIRVNLSSTNVSSMSQHVNSTYLDGLLSWSQGSVHRNQAGPACSPPGLVSTWSADPGVNHVKGTGSGSGAVSKEWTNNIQPGSCATVECFDKFNQSYYSANRNKGISQLGALKSGSGNSLSVQNMMEWQPSSNSPSSTAAGNLSTNYACAEEQGRHFPLMDHQILVAENPMRVQEVQYPNQRYTGKEQQSFIPNTLNGGMAATTRHRGPAQMERPATSQITPSNFESQNGHPHDLSNGRRFTSTFPNQVKHLHKRMPGDHPSGDPPPYPKTQRYFVTVTQDRPGTGFTAKNVIFMTDNHASALSQQLQLTSKEKTTKLDSGVTYGELSGPESQPSTAIARAESVFNIAKPTKQHKGTGASGQRAVAVVPPISQQASTSADVGSGIINTNEGLPFKIKNVWSLTEEEYVTHQKIVSQDTESDENLKLNIFTSVPATSMDSSSHSEWATPPIQKTAQAPYVVIPSMYTADADAEKNTEKSKQTDLRLKPPEVAYQSEKISVNSETLPRVSVIESGDQNGGSKGNTFDLSSVPVYEWTISKLYKLMLAVEQKQGPSDVEMDLDKLHGIYGRCSYPDLSDVFSSDLYMSIMNEACSIAPLDNHAVILSHVKGSYYKDMREKCHILTHDATFSEDVVHKSSWLNLNERLDDIDKKELGLPLYCRLTRRTLEEKCEDEKVNESDGNLPPVLSKIEFPAPSKYVSPSKDPLHGIEINVVPFEEVNGSDDGDLPPVLSKVALPAPSKYISPSKDPISALEMNVLPSEEDVNETENRSLAEAPIMQEAEELPMQTELPAATVHDLKNALSSIEISVLSCEEARRFFNGITEEAEDLLREVPKPDSKVKETQIESELPEQPLKEGVKNQMDVYCCLARWPCVMSGYGNRSVCSCQRLDQSNQKNRELSASKNENVVKAASSPGMVPLGTAQSVLSTGTSNLSGEKNVKGASDKCAMTECKSVGNPEQDSQHEGTGRNLGLPLVKRTEKRTKRSHDQSGVENQAHPKTTRTDVPRVSNIMKVDIEDLYSSYSEVSKMDSSISANVDGNAIASGSRGTRKASLWFNEVGTKCRTFGQQVGPPDAKGLERRVRGHKCKTSHENQNHKDENISKPESKPGKRKWEISNPKSSARDNLANDLEQINLKKKRKISCPQAIPEIKTTVVEHKSGTSWPEKFKGPKVSPEVKNERPRNGPTNNGGEVGKMPRNANILLVLSKEQEKAGCVSLALFGSSIQKRTGTLHSQRPMDFRPNKTKSSAGTTTPPPTTISFDISSKRTDPFQHSPPVKGLAKQQVFAKWKSSLVPAKNCCRTKPQSSKSSKNGTGIPCATPTTHPNDTDHPINQTSALLSSQPLVTPIKLKVVTVSSKKSKNGMSSKFESTENELFSKRDDRIASKNNSTKRRISIKERKSNLPAGPVFALNKVKLGRPKMVERRRYSVSDTQMKSKYELGNPALIAQQQDDDMLEFKLLPESFSFKDGQDHRESVKPKDVKRTVSAEIGHQKSESFKVSTWKCQDSWSKSSKDKDLTPLEVRSPGAQTTPSGTTFQEYKKMYMAKGKM